MGSAIAWIVAVGVLPFVLASLACFAAQKLLLWPLFEAKLCAAVSCCVLAGVGYWLSKRLLEASNHKPQPHEMVRFLTRFITLHTLSILAVAAAYLLALFWAGSPRSPWFSAGAAVFGGALGYAVFLWVLFATKTTHCGGRILLRGPALERAAKKLEQGVTDE